MASLLLQLVPFAVTCAIYLFYWSPRYQYNAASFKGIVIKCLPTLCLCFFVLPYIPSHPVKSYPLFILAGLVFALVGDALLEFESTAYFLSGLLKFAVGHVMNVIAFGFHPLKLSVLVVLVVIGAIGYIYLLPGLHGNLVLYTGLYILLTVVMDWRGMARSSLTNIKWPEICGCLGVISFSVSDMVLGINKFRFRVPHEDAIIMSTYFLAQLGISLSVVPTSLMEKFE